MLLRRKQRNLWFGMWLIIATLLLYVAKDEVITRITGQVQEILYDNKPVHHNEEMFAERREPVLNHAPYQLQLVREPVHIEDVKRHSFDDLQHVHEPIHNTVEGEGGRKVTSTLPPYPKMQPLHPVQNKLILRRPLQHNVTTEKAKHPLQLHHEYVRGNISKILQRLPQERGMPSFKHSETYLVFYGKPIMMTLWKIGRNRGWKMKCIETDTPEGLTELRKLVSLERLLVIVTVPQMYRHTIQDLASSPNALIGTIGNASRVTGSKEAELTSLRDYFQSFRCSLTDTGIMPRSFILNDPHECVQFFKYSTMQPGSWWILKPSNGHGGSGITIHSNVTVLSKNYSTCTKHPDAIVQEYITNPLLLEKRKFDIRAYILFAKSSPHYLVFYHECYLRRSVKEFDIHGSREVHVTNTKAQLSVEGFQTDDHYMSFKDFQAYLNEHRPEDGKDFISSKLVPFMQKFGLLLAHMGKLK